MLDYRSIVNERQWVSSTGLREVQFKLLVEQFKASYEFLYGMSLLEKSERISVRPLLKSYDDCLFFVLFQLKNGLCYDNLGLLIGSDGSNAQRNFERYLKVLDLALSREGVLPHRNFSGLADFAEKMQHEGELILDATEHATFRPKSNDLQKEQYSGKKNDIPTRS